MGINVTDEALEILKRSLELSKIDPAKGGIRLRSARSLSGGFDVQVELAEAALPGDEALECRGINIFVEPAVLDAIPNPVLEAELQHDIVKVLPADPAAP